jgi:hypothetical protein
VVVDEGVPLSSLNAGESFDGLKRFVFFFFRWFLSSSSLDASRAHFDAAAPSMVVAVVVVIPVW